MDHLALALRVAEKLADAAPVPFLGAVISTALQIVETVEVRPSA